MTGWVSCSTWLSRSIGRKEKTHPDGTIPTGPSRLSLTPPRLRTFSIESPLTTRN